MNSPRRSVHLGLAAVLVVLISSIGILASRAIDRVSTQPHGPVATAIAAR